MRGSPRMTRIGFAVIDAPLRRCEARRDSSKRRDMAACARAIGRLLSVPWRRPAGEPHDRMTDMARGTIAARRSERHGCRPATARFAPSPTGELHLGNARTALFNLLLARHLQGPLHPARRGHGRRAQQGRAHRAADGRPALARHRLGRRPGSRGRARAVSPVAARGRLRAALRDAGHSAGSRIPASARRWSWRCPAARSSPRASRRATRAPAASSRPSSRRRSAPPASRRPLRFRVPTGQRIEFVDFVHGAQSFLSDDIGDFVIRRADGSAAFFFSNAVDDASMGVTHVLRGEDHLTNTPRQLMVLEALGLPAPRYGHVSLLVGKDGAPLSKRHGEPSVRQYRERGYRAEAIANHCSGSGIPPPSMASSRSSEMARRSIPRISAARPRGSTSSSSTCGRRRR